MIKKKVIRQTFDMKYFSSLRTLPFFADLRHHVGYLLVLLMLLEISLLLLRTLASLVQRCDDLLGASQGEHQTAEHLLLWHGRDSTSTCLSLQVQVLTLEQLDRVKEVLLLLGRDTTTDHASCLLWILLSDWLGLLTLHFGFLLLIDKLLQITLLLSNELRHLFVLNLLIPTVRLQSRELLLNGGQLFFALFN